MTFEPRIVGFLCNWCAYAGADLAGMSRITYPPNIRIVRVMCSGRVDPVIVLETLAKGADGVMVLGCHPGDCHYVDGNLQAERRTRMLKRLLALTGLEPERLRLEWISASEGGRFSHLVKEFTAQITKLGPSPLAGDKPNKNILTNVLAAKGAAEDFRLRLLVGREKTMTEDANVFGEKVSEEKFNKTLEDIISSEYVRNKICLLLRDGPLSVKDLSKRLDLEPPKVLRHIVIMRRKGLVAIDKIEGTTPLYTALGVGK